MGAKPHRAVFASSTWGERLSASGTMETPAHRITLTPRQKCSTCVPHMCESNRNTHRITLNPQSTYPSSLGIHETTTCQTELDPYQPAKALVQTFDMIARSLTLPLAFPGGNPSTKLLASNAMSRSSIEI